MSLHAHVTLVIRHPSKTKYSHIRLPARRPPTPRATQRGPLKPGARRGGAPRTRGGDRYAHITEQSLATCRPAPGPRARCGLAGSPAAGTPHAPPQSVAFARRPASLFGRLPSSNPGGRYILYVIHPILLPVPGRWRGPRLGARSPLNPPRAPATPALPAITAVPQVAEKAAWGWCA